jgi:hypothetical protein
MLTLHHLHLTIAKSLILVHLVSTIPLILSFPYAQKEKLS